MSSNRSVSILASLFIFVAATSFRQPSASAEEFITSGDYCDIRNPGSTKVHGLKREDGRLKNTLEDHTFTIACPIMIIFAREEYNVGLTYTNNGSEHRRFKCVLTEWQLAFNEKVATYVQEGLLAPGSHGGLQFENIKLDNEYNRLHMLCSLPPQSSLDQLGMGSL